MREGYTCPLSIIYYLCQREESSTPDMQEVASLSFDKPENISYSISQCLVVYATKQYSTFLEVSLKLFWEKLDITIMEKS